MKIETIARRLVSIAPSLMLIVCFASVGLGQQTDHDILANTDKNEIVASALRIAFGTAGVVRIGLSTENIEFVDSSRMAAIGFALVDAGRVRDWETRHQPVQYVVFNKITSNDGVVSVVLRYIAVSICVNQQPKFDSTCGGFSGKRSYSFNFEFNKETGEWIGQRVYRPRLQFQGSNQLFAKP
jgi:hypothetical protein